jgi:hypothetical protein
MQPLGLTAIALLAGGAVSFVAWPFLRAAPGPEMQTPADDELRLLERRDRALAAIKELEFDHRTGNVSDEDYRALVGPLRREAADALRQLTRRDARSGRHEASPARHSSRRVGASGKAARPL